ncbi:Non-heme bromoperoxidase BPO-A2 [Microbacterium azadirachtae]|uniref:Non-heme bromoperoxidase BPO-A2 n=2 Tax=Microbacterium azadirachtae TaxID=582680 RepID=A0A0F0K8S7_9MICO|nr:alpha/beta hydrolase [Microbacterium azadirachtae]KJL17313.1 Non-heme bromoperoxidase BPO-A2 [Microbacterium azadirachtae]
MPESLADLTRMPQPQFIEAGEGVAIATYVWGDLEGPVVLIVHGFASSTRDNWVLTGWIRMLQQAGYGVLGVDQRGHGASEKPHEAAGYNVRTLAADVEQVLDTYLVDDAFYVGYSLGARVGWQVLRDLGDRIPRAVLGGVPDGIPLGRLDLDQVRRFIDDGTPVTDRVTQNYIALTERVPGNDLSALIALAQGMRESDSMDPDPATAPTQPVLFATGSEDSVIAGSVRLAEATPQGRFFEIPGRHHFNAPGAKAFREAALEFLQED